MTLLQRLLRQHPEIWVEVVPRDWKEALELEAKGTIDLHFQNRWAARIKQETDDENDR